jgi:hypothetical protein
MASERESINFKLPKPLVQALRAKARKLNTTATDLVIKGLRHVLGEVPGIEDGVEHRLYKVEQKLESIESHLEGGGDSSRNTQLQQQVEALTTKVAQLEGAIMVLQRNQNTPQKRKSSYPSPFYAREAPQLQPFKEENLAMRLVTDTATIRDNRATLTQSEFISWTKQRDPSGVGWRYDEKEKLYYPIK